MHCEALVVDQAVELSIAFVCLLTSVYLITRVTELIATMVAVEAMTAALEERLEGVRPNLNLRDTLGDGNCQYRGVAMQCRGYGDSAHGRLRKILNI